MPGESKGELLVMGLRAKKALEELDEALFKPGEKTQELKFPWLTKE